LLLRSSKPAAKRLKTDDLKKIQVIDTRGVSQDVCQVLGLANVSDAAGRLQPNERGIGETDNQLIINESGLYRLIFRSDKPEAKRFQMTQMIPFKFDTYEVRVQVDDDGNPWWVLADCCGVLALSEPHRAAARLDDQDRKKSTVLASDGKYYETWLIN